MILAVDFDGVLHDYRNPIKGRRMGAPIEGAKEAMTQLSKKHELVIHTVRGDSPQHIIDWCKYYDIPFDSVTNIKPNADCYLDDKALRFENWAQALSSLTKA